jgi:hypothetical protein
MRIVAVAVVFAALDQPPTYLSRLLSPENLPNIALVAVGVLTFVAIWWQAKKTAEATQAMREGIPLQKKTADAALLNAQAVINAERPWVMVQVETMPGENAAKSLFQLNAFNYGQTPAHIISCKGPKAEYYKVPEQDLPVPPEYGTWEWDKKFLAPRDSFPIRDPINPWDARLQFVTERAMQGVGTPNGLELVIYGLIEYTDGVSEKTYVTAFCYRRERSLLSQMGGSLVPCGPRVYNEYT